MFKELFPYTNNPKEYEAFIIGTSIVIEWKIDEFHIYRDSQLVINQTSGDYKCISPSLILYKEKVKQLLKTLEISKQGSHATLRKLKEEGLIVEQTSEEDAFLIGTISIQI